MFQIPGLCLVGAVGYGICHWFDLPDWMWGAAVAGRLLIDIVMFPFVRNAFVVHPSEPRELMIGAVAVAREGLSPRGYVELNGELWRAHLENDGSLPAGEHVQIIEVKEGLTLLVRPADAPAA